MWIPQRKKKVAKKKEKVMMMVIMINLVHQLNCPKKGGEIIYSADRSLMLAESMLNNIPLARLYIRYSLTAGYGINSFGSKTIV